MCELEVILVNGDTSTTVMESVSRMVVEGQEISLYGILGDKKTVKGSIKEINFGTGKAILVQDVS